MLSSKLAAGGILFAAFFILYALTHDRLYVFDSLLSALTIRRPLFEGPLFNVLSWNHFLWLPFLRWFYLGLKSTGFDVDPYAAIQWWNTGVGALLITFTYGFLTRHIHRGWALLISCAAGLTHLIWLRSSSGDPYLTGTMFSVLACCFLTVRSSGYGYSLLFITALTGVMAAYMHIANLILLPVIALLIAGRRGSQNLFNAVFVSLVSGVLLLPYILFYDLTTLHGLKEWLIWGSGQVNGQPPGTSVTGQFDFHFLKNVPVGFATLLHGIAAVPVNGSLLRGVIMAAAVAACAWTAIDRARKKNDWPVILPPLSFFIITAVFYSIWLPGNLFYWASPVIFFILSLALLVSPRLQNPPGLPALAVSGFFILGLGLLNFQGAIRPNLEGERVKPLVELCEGIARTTPPDSVILISGHYQKDLKVAIPYFARRRTLALDLMIIQYYGTDQDPLLAFQARLDSCLKNGIPVYMLNDVLLAKGEFGAWGVSAERIETLFRSYRIKEAARFSRSVPGALYKLE